MSRACGWMAAAAAVLLALSPQGAAAQFFGDEYWQARSRLGIGPYLQYGVRRPDRRPDSFSLNCLPTGPRLEGWFHAGPWALKADALHLSFARADGTLETRRFALDAEEAPIRPARPAPRKDLLRDLGRLVPEAAEVPDAAEVLDAAPVRVHFGVDLDDAFVDAFLAALARGAGLSLHLGKDGARLFKPRPFTPPREFAAEAELLLKTGYCRAYRRGPDEDAPPRPAGTYWQSLKLEPFWSFAIMRNIPFPEGVTPDPRFADRPPKLYILFKCIYERGNLSIYTNLPRNPRAGDALWRELTALSEPADWALLVRREGAADDASLAGMRIGLDMASKSRSPRAVISDPEQSRRLTDLIASPEGASIRYLRNGAPVFPPLKLRMTDEDRAFAWSASGQGCPAP